MTKIQKLQQELEMKSQKAIKEAQERAQEAVLSARIKLIDSTAYQQALAKEAEYSFRINRLKELVNACKEVIVTMPLYNAETRSERKWNGRYVFAYGTDIQYLFHLVSGIRYSASQHKEVMLEITGLNELTIDLFLDSMGSPAYVNNYGEYVPHQPYDVDASISAATLLSTQLGLNLDVSKLTEAIFQKDFSIAEAKAQQHLAEAQLTPSTNLTIQ